jgi:hypothetical protein
LLKVDDALVLYLPPAAELDPKKFALAEIFDMNRDSKATRTAPSVLVSAVALVRALHDHAGTSY